MFVYGVCAGPSDKLERIARPGILRAAPSATVLVRRGWPSIHTAYNSIFEEAAGLTDLEGLVLLHDDTEILSEDFEDRLRRAFADPGVGVVGPIGGSDHPEMAWWGGARKGAVRDDQQGQLDYGGIPGDVDTVDGLLMAFSPRAVHTLRCDTRRFRGFHGYDADLCAEARRRGMRVRVADLAIHHRNNTTAWLGDELAFHIADATYRLKWRKQSARDRLRLRARHAKLVLKKVLRDRSAARRAPTGARPRA